MCFEKATYSALRLATEHQESADLMLDIERVLASISNQFVAGRAVGTAPA